MLIPILHNNLNLFLYLCSWNIILYNSRQIICTTRNVTFNVNKLKLIPTKLQSMKKNICIFYMVWCTQMQIMFLRLFMQTNNGGEKVLPFPGWKTSVNEKRKLEWRNCEERVLNYSNGLQCLALDEKSSALTFIDLTILQGRRLKVNFSAEFGSIYWIVIGQLSICAILQEIFFRCNSILFAFWQTRTFRLLYFHRLQLRNIPEFEIEFVQRHTTNEYILCVGQN